MKRQNETNTIVGIIRPTLIAYGYPENPFVTEDVDYEHRCGNRQVDLMFTVRTSKNKYDVPLECKSFDKRLSKHEEQAQWYGNQAGSLIHILANGKEYRTFNTKTGEPLKNKDGSIRENLFLFDDLPALHEYLEQNPEANCFAPENISNPASLVRSLSHEDFGRICKNSHNTFRNNEHLSNQEALSDFSNLLDLKLYEDAYLSNTEAAASLQPLIEDSSGVWNISYTFAYMADPKNRVSDDDIKVRVLKMWQAYKELSDRRDIYRDEDVNFHSKHAKTFATVVKYLNELKNDNLDGIEARGLAYSKFLAAFMRGKGLGEFFTPRPIVDAMVEIMDPKNNERVGDTCFGSAGFLRSRVQRAWNSIKRNDSSSNDDKREQLRTVLKNTYGVEKNKAVIRIAKTNLHFDAGASVNLYQGDSLLNTGEQVADIFAASNKNRIEFDVQLLNPPFGKKAGEMGDLSFWKAQGFEIPTTGSSQILFIQRMIDHGTKEGRIATIIDNGVLNGKSGEVLNTREYLFKKCYVVAVISLPDHTFTPYGTNATTSILIFKNKETNKPQKKPVLMIRLDHVGYDKKGKETQENDLPNTINAVKTWVGDWKKFDGSLFSDQEEKLVESIENKWDKAFFVDVESIIESGYRLDVNNHDPQNTKALSKAKQEMSNANWLTIGELVKKGALSIVKGFNVQTSKGHQIPLEEGGSVVQIRTANCRDGYIDLEYGNREGYFLQEDLPFKDAVLQNKDIIFCKKGASVTGRVDLFINSILEEGQTAVVNAFLNIFRCNLNSSVVLYPEYLYVCLRSDFCRGQVKKHIRGNADSPEINEEGIEKIEIPILPKEEQEKAVSVVRQKQSEIVTLEQRKRRLISSLKL